MKIDLNIRNYKEANDFLECFWAEIGKKFENASWQYIPYKIKEKEEKALGCIDLKECISEVCIGYSNKYVLKYIRFEIESTENLNEVETKLLKAYENTKNNIQNKLKFNCQLSFNIYSTNMHSIKIQINHYKGDDFLLYPCSDESTSACIFDVLAYDENQAEAIALETSERILDFLAVETNIPFYIKSIKHTASHITNQNYLNKNEIYQKNDFIDDSSIQENRILISKEAKKFLDLLLNPYFNHNHEFIHVSNAFYLAHQGMFFSNQMITYHGDPNNIETFVTVESNFNEIVLIHLMSSLETISLIGFTSNNCEYCNQPKYSIGKRVSDLVNKYMNDWIVKDFRSYYNTRSSYIHKGELLRKSPLYRRQVPLLDKYTDSGLREIFPFHIINVKEYTTYCLRAYYKELLNTGKFNKPN